jgi:hypothetical protein
LPLVFYKNKEAEYITNEAKQYIYEEGHVSRCSVLELAKVGSDDKGRPPFYKPCNGSTHTLQLFGNISPITADGMRSEPKEKEIE